MKHIIKSTSDQTLIQVRGLSFKRMTWASVLVASLVCSFSSCSTLDSNPNESMALPNPVIDTENPQFLLDNIPNINREKLLKVLPDGNERFLVVGFNSDNAVGTNNNAFIRRYFVTATGLGLDTAFGMNGQITINLPGNSQQIHSAVLFQEAGNPPKVLLVGSRAGLPNQRIPFLTRVNLMSGIALTSVFGQLLNTGLFPNEEPININLTNETPPKVVIGFQRDTNNLFRVIRLIRTPQFSEFALDNTFSGDGIHEIIIPQANPPLNIINLKLTDLEIAANSSIVVSGTMRSPNLSNDPLNQNLRGFVCRITSIPFLTLSNCNTELPLRQANAITIDENNRIVVAGQVEVGGQTKNLAVARLTSTLALDTTFGASAGTPNLNSGFNSTCFIITFTPLQPEGCFDSTGIDIALDLQGRIVVAGDTSLAMAIARFTPNGQQLDNTFSQDGRLIFTETPSTTSAAQTSSLALFGQNRIVVGGTTRSLGFGLVSNTLAIQRLVAP